jgi:uncharacterized repeat protein (TIGR01451 family)
MKSGTNSTYSLKNLMDWIRLAVALSRGRTFFSLWVSVLFCISLTTHAGMFGYATDANGIYRINANTAATTTVYSGTPFNGTTVVAGLAQRPSDGMLFFSQGNSGNDQIYRWDPATPAVAPVLLGTTGSGVPYMLRMAFHPTSGVLYGFDLNGTRLWTINQATGAATQVAAITGFPANVSGDMAFQPGTNILYVVARTAANTIRIYTVPLAGGAVTQVGTVTGIPDSTSAVAAVMFDTSGALLLGGSSNNNMYSVPVNGGAATNVGSIGISPQDFGSVPAAAPSVTKSFSPTVVNLSTDSTLTLTLSNSYSNAVRGATITDTYPAGLVNSPTPSASSTCGGTVTASAGGNSVSLSGGTIPSSGSCTITVKVRSASTGAYTNTIAAGSLTTLLGFNDATASATLNVMQFPSLVHLKTVSIVSDPINGTTNPKYIPGAIVQYTLRVTNTGPGTAGSVVITDPIPANTDFFAGDLGAVGSGPIQFVDGTPSSGLSWTFTSLGSGADSVDFSNNGGTTWTYTPVPVGGYDSNVTAIRLKPNGTMNGTGGGNPYFDLNFRVRVK